MNSQKYQATFTIRSMKYFLKPWRQSMEVKPPALGPSEAEAWGLSPLQDLSASPCDGPQMLTSKCVFCRVFKARAKRKQCDRKCPRPVIRRQTPGPALPAVCRMPQELAFASLWASFSLSPFESCNQNSKHFFRSMKAPRAAKVNDPNSNHGRCLFIEKRG